MPASVLSISGNPGPTVRFAFADNTVKTLAEMGVGIVDGNGTPMIGFFVSVETNAARFAEGGAIPQPAGLGHVIASAGSKAFVYANCKDVKFCNSVADSNAVLQITPYFPF